MIADPQRRGVALAGFYHEVAPRLFTDLEESGTLPAEDGSVPPGRARAEWACFALYACVRGLVAAGGFNRETAAAIESLHAQVLGAASGDDASELALPRALIAERYAEYGAIGQAGGRSGADSVAQRLGEAAARHVTAPAAPSPALAETIGALHEALAEGAAEAVRRAVEGET